MNLSSPPHGFHLRPLFAFSLALFLLCIFAGSLLAEDKELTVQQLIETPAAKYYIAKQYHRALDEFQKLEKEYPRSVLVKRYIASIDDALHEWDAAVAKLNETLAIKADDVISRQLLGDIYIKQAELDKAEQEFQILAKQDPASAAGQYATQRLKDIIRLKAQPKTQAGKSMAPQDFMKSAPAQAFSNGDYKKAVQGLEELMQTYPQDVLIRRFRGISLMRLGKTDEAIQALADALAIAPDNVAAHFYLGQAYAQKNKMEEARKEFQYVIAHDQASYRLRAQQAIFLTLNRGGAAPKKFSASITTGYEYDTNATYKSRDDTMKSPGDQNSGRYPLTVTGTYRLYQKKRLSLTSDAFYAQSLYNDFPTLQTFTSGGGVSALYVFSIFNKPAFFNLRDGLSHTLLRDHFYLWSESLSPSLIYMPHKQYRATLSYRWSYNNYQRKANTNDPDRRSRNGFTNVFSFSNNFYFNDEKTFYLMAGYDYERHFTQGVDYRKSVHGGSVGLHFPIVAKIEGEANFKFKDSRYPKYAEGSPDRRDDDYLYTFTLSRPFFRDTTTLSATYTFDCSDGRNNLYEYRKHVFGVSVTYRY